MSWDLARRLRLAEWVRSDDVLRDVVERVGKSAYLESDRDPFAAVLPYMALGLGKLPLLRNLFRLSLHQKVFTFLQNDFTDDRWRKVAAKNAFALLAQHRYEPALGFFLLAGRPAQAIKTATMELRDPLLALTLARLTATNAAAPTAAAGGSGGAATTTPLGCPFGGMDVVTVVHDAAALVAAERAANAPANAGAGVKDGGMGGSDSSRGHAISSARSGRGRIAGVGRGRAGARGFGFDDENDVAVPAPPPPPAPAPGGGDAGATVAASISVVATSMPPSTGGGTGLPPTTCPHLTPLAGVPAAWQLARADIDTDPVAYVVQSEYLAPAMGIMLPTPSGIAQAWAGDDAAAAVAWVLWLHRRPIAAGASLLQTVIPWAAWLSGSSAPTPAISLTMHAAARAVLASPSLQRGSLPCALLLAALPPRQGASDNVTAIRRLVTASDPFLSRQVTAAATALAHGTAAAAVACGKGAPGSRGLPVSLAPVEASMWDGPTPADSTTLTAVLAPIAASLQTAVAAVTTSAAGELLEGVSCAGVDMAIEQSAVMGRGGVEGGSSLAHVARWTRRELVVAGCDTVHLRSYVEQAMASWRYVAAYNAVAVAAEDGLLVGTGWDVARVIDGLLDASLSTLRGLKPTTFTTITPICKGGEAAVSPPSLKQAAVHARLGAAATRVLAQVALDDKATTRHRLLPLAVAAWIHLLLAAAMAQHWDRVLELVWDGAAQAGATPVPDAGDGSPWSMTPLPRFCRRTRHLTACRVIWEAAITMVAPPPAPGAMASGAAATHRPLEMWLSAWVNAAASALLWRGVVGGVASAQGGVPQGGGASSSSHPYLPRCHAVVTRVADAAAAAVMQGRVPWSERGLWVLLQRAAPSPLVVDDARSGARGLIGDVWGANHGPRAPIIAGLTGVVPPRHRGGVAGPAAAAWHMSSDAAWWQDTAALLHPPAMAADGSSMPPSRPVGLSVKEMVWCALGGPGLLWLLSTERRAMARAYARAHRGYLPDVKASTKVEVRPRGGPAILSLITIAQPSVLTGRGSPLSPLAATSSGLPGHAHTTVEAGPCILLSTADAGVVHAELRRRRVGVVHGGGEAWEGVDHRSVSSASTSATATGTTSHTLGRLSSALDRPRGLLRHVFDDLGGSGRRGSMGGDSVASREGGADALHASRERRPSSSSGVAPAASMGLRQTVSSASLSSLASTASAGGGVGGGVAAAGTLADATTGVPDASAITVSPTAGIQGHGHPPSHPPPASHAHHYGGGGAVGAAIAASITSIGRATQSKLAHQVRDWLSHGSTSASTTGPGGGAVGGRSASHAVTPAPLTSPLPSRSTPTSFLSKIMPHANKHASTPSSLQQHTASVGVGVGSGFILPPPGGAHPAPAPTAGGWRGDGSNVFAPPLVDMASTSSPDIINLGCVGGDGGGSLGVGSGEAGYAGGDHMGAEDATGGASGGIDVTAPPVSSRRPHTPHITIDVHPTDRYEYAMPFTLAPTSMAHHPSAPLYVRGGPQGTVAVCSITLEPMAAAAVGSRANGGGGGRNSWTGSAWVGGGGDGTVTQWHQFVHRLVSVLSYTALPSSTYAHSGVTTTLDEHVTRVRWSPDGRGVAAAFASGVVRVWDAGIADKPTHLLSTSGSHALAPSTTLEDGSLVWERPVWSATDVCIVTMSTSLLAATAAPLFAQPGGASPLGGGGGTSPKTSTSAVGFSGGSRTTTPGSAPPTPSLPTRVSSTGSLGANGAFGATSPPALPTTDGGGMGGATGWGLHLFDLRTRDATVAMAAPYGLYAGCTALYVDDPGLQVVCGCEDGGLLVYDIRAGRVRLHIPGVPTASAGGRGAAVGGGGMRTSGGEAGVVVADTFGHMGSVTTMTGHPSQRLLGTGGQDGEVKLWSLPHLTHCATVTRLHAPKRWDFGRFSADRTLAHRCDWLEAGGVSALAMTEEGVVSGGWDGSVVVVREMW